MTSRSQIPSSDVAKNDISLVGHLMEKGGNGCERLFIIAVQNGRQQGVQVLSLGFRQSRKQRGGSQPFQKSRNRKGIEHKVAEPDIRRRARLAVEAVKCVDPYLGANMPAFKQDANRSGKLHQFRLLKGADDNRLTQVKRRGDPAENPPGGDSTAAACPEQRRGCVRIRQEAASG